MINNPFEDGSYASEMAHKPPVSESIVLPTIEPIESIQDDFCASEVWPDITEELHKPYPAIELPDWPKFNEATGGFRSKEFTLLCGSTGSGKTQLLASISYQLLKKRVKHFVLSVETGHHDFVRRVASQIIGTDINKGKAHTPGDIISYSAKTLPLLATGCLRVSVWDNRINVERLIEKLRYAKEVYGSEIAMIDNLNFFMDISSDQNQVYEMDRTTHSLIMFCKQIDMHIIMVCHPKKPPIAMDTRVYSEFDIKGSSTAVQEAHNIMLFNRPHYLKVEAAPDIAFHRELTFAKLRRRGEYAGHTLVFNGSNGIYRERELHNKSAHLMAKL